MNNLSQYNRELVELFSKIVVETVSKEDTEKKKFDKLAERTSLENEYLYYNEELVTICGYPDFSSYEHEVDWLENRFLEEFENDTDMHENNALVLIFLEKVKKSFNDCLFLYEKLKDSEWGFEYTDHKKIEYPEKLKSDYRFLTSPLNPAIYRVCEYNYNKITKIIRDIQFQIDIRKHLPVDFSIRNSFFRHTKPTIVIEDITKIPVNYKDIKAAKLDRFQIPLLFSYLTKLDVFINYSNFDMAVLASYLTGHSSKNMMDSGFRSLEYVKADKNGYVNKLDKEEIEYFNMSKVRETLLDTVKLLDADLEEIKRKNHLRTKTGK